MDSYDERPKSQYIFLYLGKGKASFAICTLPRLSVDQDVFPSILQYPFGVLLSMTEGQVPLLRVNETLVDLEAFICQIFIHCSIMLRWCYSCLEAMAVFSCKARMVVSSAKIAGIMLLVVFSQLCIAGREWDQG